MNKVLIVVAAITVFVILLVVGPWLTFEAFQELTGADTEFTFGAWLAAAWVNLIFAFAGSNHFSNK